MPARVPRAIQQYQLGYDDCQTNHVDFIYVLDIEVAGQYFPRSPYDEQMRKQYLARMNLWTKL